MIDKIQESGTVIEKNFTNSAELTPVEQFHSDQLDDIMSRVQIKSVEELESDFIDGLRTQADIQLSLVNHQLEQKDNELIAEIERKEARIKELEQVIGVIAANQYVEKQGPMLPAAVAVDSDARIYPKTVQ